MRTRGRDEIALLLGAFLISKARVYGVTVPRLAADAREALLTYNWPGNVRELESAVERALALCDNGLITLENLTARIRIPFRAAVREGNRADVRARAAKVAA